MVPQAIEDESTEPTVVGAEIPICEVCNRIISARDIQDYRQEAGIPHALPSCCTDCAEGAV